MFFDYEFHTLFTLFAFILIKVLCDKDTDSDIIPDTTPRVDLRNFNMSVYCKFQPVGAICNTFVRTNRKYYFDIHLNRCVRFEYGHCNHSYNMFNEKRQCMDACRDDVYDEVSDTLPETVYCRFQPAFGDCHSYHPSWYFDTSNKLCKGFSYSGCGGNRNRFETSLECRDVCGTALAYSNK